MSEGLLSATLATSAPLGLSNFSTSAISFVTTWILTPSQPLFVSPNSISWLITFFALFEGIAKPIPIEPDWPKIAVLIPITSPSISKSGPPEFPTLIEASVWIKSSYLDNPISLFLAEIIPDVTVPPKPNGLPIAITQSPILALSESPNLTGINFLLDSILRTAISDNGSDPKTFALNSSSPSTLTIMSSAPLMTWLLVITIPSASIIKPEPKALAFLFWGSPNSLNISSNGDPGGNSKGNGFVLVTTVWVVDIFTTDIISFSAKSAKDSGGDFAFVTKEKLKNIIEIMIILIFLSIILFFNIPNYKKTNYSKYKAAWS